MAFCSNCGNQISDQGAFCSSCGSAVSGFVASKTTSTTAQSTPSNSTPTVIRVLSALGLIIFIASAVWLYKSDLVWWKALLYWTAIIWAYMLPVMGLEKILKPKQ